MRQVGSLLRVIGGLSVRYVSTRGSRARARLHRRRCWPVWPPTAACTCPPSGPRCRPVPPGADVRRARRRSRSQPFVGDDIAARHRAAAVPRGLRHVPPPGGRAARADRRRRTSCEELFHGPTLAFKDVALQLVGRLFDHVLARTRAAGHHRRRHQRRHRLGGHRRREGAAPTSTSSSSTRTAAPATCSASR